MISNENIAIVTTTFYNLENESDRLRASIARKTIENAVDERYNVFVIDGGSSSSFVNEIKGLSATISTQQKSGMGNGRREVFEMAYNCYSKPEVIVWVEPEKDLTRNQCLSKILLPFYSREIDIVIPGRTEASMSTLPKIQEYTERAINYFWKDLSGKEWDFCFGPKAWTREITPYFLNYQGEKDEKGIIKDSWHVLFIPILQAMKDGKNITSVNVDFTYPLEQVRIETSNLDFNNKRITQLTEVTNFLERGWNKIFD